MMLYRQHSLWPTPRLTPASLRQLIHKIFPADSELHAFITDCLDLDRMQWHGEIDRISLVNLILHQYNANRLFELISGYEPERVAANRYCLRYSYSDFHSPWEDAFEKLRKGWFAVDAPQKMQVGIGTRICASAIRDWMQKELIESGLELDDSQIEEMLLASRLDVRLVPDDNADFSVKSLSERIQPVFTQDKTIWEWLVIPKQPGDGKKLRVVATSILDSSGKPQRKSHPVKTIIAEVIVHNNPRRPSLFQRLRQAWNDDSRLTSPRESTEKIDAIEQDDDELGQRASLRRKIKETLRTDSDLEAFCSDYFYYSVYSRFSNGMDREHKVTILLNNGCHDKILDKITEARHDRCLAP
jgi:hypothetical protein